MKVTSRIAHLGIVVGVTLVASNANAALRFYYAYGDAGTVLLQQRTWAGITPNAAATLHGEIPNGATIAVSKFADNSANRFEVWVENTGADLYVNSSSIFNAFSSGAADTSVIWGAGASGAVGSAAAAAAHLGILKNGGAGLATSSPTANVNTLINARTFSGGAWVDPDPDEDPNTATTGGFTAVRDYAIQGSDEAAASPLSGRYAGYSVQGGFADTSGTIGASAQFLAGSRTRLFDILLKAGASLPNLTLIGDTSNEVGLRLLAGGTTPGAGSFFLGAKDSSNNDVNVSYQGANHRILSTPEPGTYAALALGAAAIMRRRKKA